jgi:hypothetical protein
MNNDVAVLLLQMAYHINTMFNKVGNYSKGGLTVGQWGEIFALEMATKGVKSHRKKIEVRRDVLPVLLKRDDALT